MRLSPWVTISLGILFATGGMDFMTPPLAEKGESAPDANGELQVENVTKIRRVKIGERKEPIIFLQIKSRRAVDNWLDSAGAMGEKQFSGRELRVTEPRMERGAKIRMAGRSECSLQILARYNRSSGPGPRRGPCPLAVPAPILVLKASADWLCSGRVCRSGLFRRWEIAFSTQAETGGHRRR